MSASTSAGAAVLTHRSARIIRRARVHQLLLGLGLMLGLSLASAPTPAQAGPITDVVDKVTKKVDRVTKSSTKKAKATTKKVTKAAKRTVSSTRQSPARSSTSSVRSGTTPLAPARGVVNPRVLDRRVLNGSQLPQAAEPVKKTVRVVRVTTRNLAKPVIFSTSPVVDRVVDLAPDQLDPVLDTLPDLTEPLLPGTPPLLPPGGPGLLPGGPVTVTLAGPPTDPGPATTEALDNTMGTTAPATRPGTDDDLRPSSTLATSVAFLLTGRPGADPESTSTYTWAAVLVPTAGAVTGLSLGATGAAGALIPVFAGVAFCGPEVRPGQAWRMPRVTRAGPTHVWTTPPEPGFSPD